MALKNPTRNFMIHGYGCEKEKKVLSAVFKPHLKILIASIEMPDFSSGIQCEFLCISTYAKGERA
jgi:hypothetical protein